MMRSVKQLSTFFVSSSKSFLLCYKSKMWPKYLLLSQRTRKIRKPAEKELTLKSSRRSYSSSQQKPRKCWIRWYRRERRRKKRCRPFWMLKKVQEAIISKPKIFLKVPNLNRKSHRKKSPLYKMSIYSMLKMWVKKLSLKSFCFCDCLMTSRRWKKDTNKHCRWRHLSQGRS